METRSQFTGRYKKDLSTDHLRAKVARRKSITQKENRHKEFRKSRGLSLVDVNVSHVKNGELSTLDEVFEASLSKEKENKENKTATVKNNDKLLNQRREMLLRFKEEKQLRKLKEQREKAGRGTFRCGIYKPDVTVPPVFSSQNAGKAKVTDKPAPPTRVTRSMAKTEPTVKATTRTQHVTAPLLNKSKITAERSVPKGRGQISTVKKTEKEQKALTTVPLATRAKTTAAVTKVPSKITAVAKPPRKTVNEIKPNKTAKNEDVVEKQIVEHSSVEDDEPPNVTKAPTFEIGTLKEACVTVKERKPSFAPQNFMFQPLEGLSAFKFQPMTPHRVDEFLTPGYMWSPVQPERLNVAISPKPKTEEHSEPLPTEQTPDICELQMDTNLCAPQESECTGDTCSGALDVQPPVSPVTSEEVTQTESVPAAPEEPKHDVLYFRNVLKSELQRLTELCSRWNERIEIDIPEEAKDLIRTTVGQTRLLMTERFKQFEGLVDNCEFKRGEKETTCTDLEGFWDMVYFQIEDVVNKFVNLEKLEKNSWQQQTSVQTKKVVKKKMASVTATKPSQDDNGRAAARSRLAAIKAALKNKGKPEQPEVQVADPEQPAQVVFEAGFFRIESPAKVVRGIRTTQTPKSLLKSLKNSENPASNSAANENVDAPNTSDDGSPVRKMLFDSAEESVPEAASCPKSAELEGVEAYSASCVDLGKYLVPVAHFSLDLRESSVFAQLSTQTDEFPLAGESVSRGESIVDDVFMSSPEKVPHETTVCSATESHGTCEAGELKPGCALLEFLGHCTPSHLAEVKRVSRRLGAVVETNDLIVFSPLEK